MKLFKLATLCLFLTLGINTSMQAQKFNGLDKSPMDAAIYPSSPKETAKKIKVIYSRPQLNGRSLDQLTPIDKVWRTGANEATEITFYKNMTIGDSTIKAGTYSLFTIPGKKTWTIILNSDLNVWGAYSYNEAHDVLRYNAIVNTDSESIEAFSIAFDEEGTMYLAWGTTRVRVPFRD